jgi:hypothetical protein
MSRSVSSQLPCALVIALIALMLSCVGAGAQTIITVPTNYPTIQAAINAANDGDTVLVAPGTYVENINFNGKAITVTSSGGAAITIIDGNANGSVVVFNHTETSSSTLSGLTIRNGLQSGLSGGGILVSAASPTITNNIITGNHAATGIGMYINRGSPVITKNIITGNDQKGAGDGGGGGGGILVAGGPSAPANPQIIGNTITNNSVASGGEGAGISVTYFSGPLIQGNLISGNSAYNGGGGISLESYNSSVVSDNVIVSNTGGSGAGMWVYPGNFVTTISNNTMVDNSASDGTSGVFVSGVTQNLNFVNNIVVATAGQTAVTCDAAPSPVFSHNEVYSPTGTTWTAACDHTSNPGNFSSDPLFLSAANNDFHLSAASPAVDAGANSAQNLPSLDFDNNPRIMDGNGDGLAVVDLGAYEVVNTSSANLSPSALSFYSQAVGSASAAQAVSLSSLGSTPFQVSSVQISGDFAENTTCPALGAPGDSTGVAGGSACTYTVTFTPITNGMRTGFLTVNGTNGTSLTVALTGVSGTVPLGSLSSSSLVFSKQVVGTPSASQAVTFSNVGGAPFDVSSISTSGAFAQTNNCGTSVAVGSACAVIVTFNPGLFGPANGTLTIQDSVNSLIYSVTLSGTGTDFSVALSSSSSNVLAGNTTRISVYVNPLGGNFANAVSLSCAGLPTNSLCSFAPASVVPDSSGATSTITITSQTSTPGGTFPITITGSSGSNLSHLAQLQLTILKPGLTLSTASLNFANQPLGSVSGVQTVTLTNTNVGTVSLTSIAASGPFVLTNNCASVLPINSSCTIGVSFAPSVSGSFGGILNIQDVVDGLSYSVNLSGTGVDFSIAPSATSVTVARGSSSSITISVSPLGGTFQNSVALSCSGLPIKTTCAYSQPNVVPGSAGGSSMLTISTDPSATQAGTYTMTITGMSGSLSHSMQLQLTVSKPKH